MRVSAQADSSTDLKSTDLQLPEYGAENFKFPLGPRREGQQVTFPFHSTGKSVTLCLFSESGKQIEEVPLYRVADSSYWEVTIENVPTGQLYGFRVDGEFAPRQAPDFPMFESNKLLLDPGAMLIGRELLDWNPELLRQFGVAQNQGETKDGKPHKPKNFKTNTAGIAPLARVPDNNEFDFGQVPAPDHAWSDLIIYQLHIDGFTALNKLVPEQYRGKFLGLTQPVAIEYLKDIGFNAVEILPIMYGTNEPVVHGFGQKNYWNFNTAAFCAPDPRFAVNPDKAIHECKRMINALHKAGIEVILQLVPGHTAEGTPSGSRAGPTMGFRAADPAMYKRNELGNYIDYSYCGNTLDFGYKPVREYFRQVMRYWCEEYRVDGFRIDQAPIVGREDSEFNPKAEFLRMLEEDPILSKVKIEVEPFDVHPERHNVTGEFLGSVREWDGAARESYRRFWMPAAEINEENEADRSRVVLNSVRDFAMALIGNPHIFNKACESKEVKNVIYTASHDGFTTRDVVTYDRRQNWANGEQNRDGHPETSYNHGQEGPVKDNQIENRRWHTIKNLVASLFLSQGTPLVRSGDEYGQSAQANSNLYCQQELSRVNWDDRSLRDEVYSSYVSQLIQLRSNNDVLRYPVFGNGNLGTEAEPIYDLHFYNEAGYMIHPDSLQAAPGMNGDSPTGFGLLYSKVGMEKRLGESLQGSTMYLMANNGGRFPEHRRVKNFQLPKPTWEPEGKWEAVFTTEKFLDPFNIDKTYEQGQEVQIKPGELMLVRLVPDC